MEARKTAEEARSEVEGLRASLESAKQSAGQAEEKTKAQTDLWEEERGRLTKRVEDANTEISRLQEQILKVGGAHIC